MSSTVLHYMFCCVGSLLLEQQMFNLSARLLYTLPICHNILWLLQSVCSPSVQLTISALVILQNNQYYRVGYWLLHA